MSDTESNTIPHHGDPTHSQDAPTFSRGLQRILPSFLVSTVNLPRPIPQLPSLERHREALRPNDASHPINYRRPSAVAVRADRLYEPVISHTQSTVRDPPGLDPVDDPSVPQHRQYSLPAVSLDAHTPPPRQNTSSCPDPSRQQFADPGPDLSLQQAEASNPVLQQHAGWPDPPSPGALRPPLPVHARSKGKTSIGPQRSSPTVDHHEPYPSVGSRNTYREPVQKRLLGTLRDADPHVSIQAHTADVDVASIFPLSSRAVTDAMRQPSVPDNYNDHVMAPPPELNEPPATTQGKPASPNEKHTLPTSPTQQDLTSISRDTIAPSSVPVIADEDISMLNIGNAYGTVNTSGSSRPAPEPLLGSVHAVLRSELQQPGTGPMPNTPSRPLPLPHRAGVYLTDEQVGHLAGRLAPMLTQALLDFSRSNTWHAGPQGGGFVQPSADDGDDTELEDTTGVRKAQAYGQDFATRRAKAEASYPKGLHNAIRKYLVEKQLYLSSSARDRALPVANPMDVSRYEADAASPPTLSNIAFDWPAALESRWNKYVLDILSVNFYQKVEEGMAIEGVDRHTVDLSTIRTLIKTKITTTRNKVNETRAATTAEEQERLRTKAEHRYQLDRMNTRRHGTYQRRKRIVTFVHAGIADDTWRDIDNVLTRLDSAGMSDDETDDEGPPKVLRRVRIPWLHPDISELFRRVESYHQAVRAETLTHLHRGNRSYPRDYEAIHVDSARPVIQGLPANYYHPEWLRTLNDAARQMLQMQANSPLPDLMPSKTYARGFVVDMDALRRYLNAFNFSKHELPPLQPTDPNPEGRVGAYHARMERVQSEVLPKGKQLEFLYWFVTQHRETGDFRTYFFIPTSRASEKAALESFPMVERDRKRLQHFMATTNGLLPEGKQETCAFKRENFRWRAIPEMALFPNLHPMVNVD
ncbi:hypothetical protein CONPUDRAFT_152865 [Coniophora puteana RWD-64-598 SS2]|uniref:Uncharacterized protein n=1 Tax=Coniophora puteana (strain RWD-64-598) TaxID=741705 RepID=A0A5M3MS33_CONPW|nr:uncharacterized protein CONPUDRAFT_152865 [Coniophora puteana RWD-64-598 SS2]EIW81972.1 hypothetical protein CONPUDRAFT_152865 [Coniophora puteana RWD-64-598 SS2]